MGLVDYLCKFQAAEAADSPKNFKYEYTPPKVKLQAHFHDVDGDLYEHTVAENFGFSKIRTVILLYSYSDRYN